MSPESKSGGADPAARAPRAIERRASGLSMSVARSLYERWRRMPAARRQKLERIAEDVKSRALDMRGESDQAVAGAELKAANEKLVDAMLVSAQADPDVSEIQVRDLRADLERELDRLASGEIQASRASDGVTGGVPPDRSR